MGKFKRDELASEPVLASTYKLLKALDDDLARAKTDRDRWQIFGGVQRLLGNPRVDPVEDRVSYGQMREFIQEFMDKWELI